MSTLFELLLGFLQVGLFSVGGGYAAIPLIQNQIVDAFHLMTMEEFADLITIAEMTPGPISINSATFVGMRVAGIPGAILCTFGCILFPFIICLILAHYYYKYRNFSGVQTVLSCLRPAVVSLISCAGLSILTLAVFKSGTIDFTLGNINYVETLLFLVSLFLLRKYKLGAIKIILGSGVVGTLMYLLIPGLL
ncbi:MAG TPA: chromate transporter [Lachnospiraceae bacterium]|nr:chromate transporter [Lachnospiraceae bacterium]